MFSPRHFVILLAAKADKLHTHIVMMLEDVVNYISSETRSIWAKCGEWTMGDPIKIQYTSK